MKRTTKKGFTLVEILIVVIILGILAAIVIPQFSQASTEARVSSLKTNLQTIRSQLELSQITYMDEDPPYAFRDDKADSIRPILRRLLGAMLDWGAASQGVVGRPARTVA